MPRKGSPYGPGYERERRRLLGKPCRLRLVCSGDPATEADHVPPLSRHRHVDGSGCCKLQPACGPCQRRQAVTLANETRRAAAVAVELDEVVEPDGFPLDSPVWRVDWLEDLLDVPGDAVWPRLMTAPHPVAVGSLGVEFEWWARTHRGITLRWWQRLVARRLLEVDAAGRLVWIVLILTLARQLGKSWLLQLILAWRLHQGARLGQPQRILHMSIQMSQVRDVMEREITRAEQRPELYATLDNNNETSITWLDDGSRWVRVVRGTKRAGGAYGQSGVGAAVVDEAWSIDASVIDDGLEPTIVEGEQPWLMLISTAHRLATALMIDRRAAALGALDTDEGGLLIEWSTPRHYALEDVDGWRLASPHWTRQREQLLRGAVRRALSGVAVADDTGETDPVESFRAQWLNQWPGKLTARGKGEPLLPPGRWAELRVEGDAPERVWVAVADNFGHGAAIGVVAEIGDGRFEVDGWLCEDRDAALADARATPEQLGVHGELVADPSLASAAGDADDGKAQDVRFGLPLLRQLVQSGRLLHDDTPELDAQLAECRVHPVSGGLALSTLARSDIVRAVALALRAAIVDVPLPMVHTAARRGG